MKDLQEDTHVLAGRIAPIWEGVDVRILVVHLLDLGGDHYVYKKSDQEGSVGDLVKRTHRYIFAKYMRPLLTRPNKPDAESTSQVGNAGK